MKKYLIIGPAASGKDWLQQRFVDKGYIPLVSYTTRPKRPNENGTEYHFVSQTEMGKMIRDMRFLSLKNFISWWYGFTKNDFANADVAIITRANLLDLRFELGNEMKDYDIIYLDMPEELRRYRLSNRYTGGNVDDTADRRINADKKDFEDFEDFTIRLTSKEEVEDFINKIPTKG